MRHRTGLWLSSFPVCLCHTPPGDERTSQRSESQHPASLHRDHRRLLRRARPRQELEEDRLWNVLLPRNHPGDKTHMWKYITQHQQLWFLLNLTLRCAWLTKILIAYHSGCEFIVNRLAKAKQITSATKYMYHTRCYQLHLPRNFSWADVFSLVKKKRKGSEGKQ